MVLGASIVSPLEDSIIKLRVFSHSDTFGTWEGSLVIFSLDILAGLMIGTG